MCAYVCVRSRCWSFPLEFLPGTVLSALLILISSALQAAACASLLIPLCSWELGFCKILKAEFELHIRAAFLCIGWVERPSPLESFLSLGVKLIYFVNKGELREPWASFRTETIDYLTVNAHSRKDMTRLRLCLATEDCLCHSLLIHGFICSLE